MLSGVVPRLQCDPSNMRSASSGWACSCIHSINLSVAFMLGSRHVLVNKRFTLCAWIIYHADLASSGFFPIKCNVLTVTKTFPEHCGFPWFQFSRSVVSDFATP